MLKMAVISYGLHHGHQQVGNTLVAEVLRQLYHWANLYFGPIYKCSDLSILHQTTRLYLLGITSQYQFYYYKRAPRQKHIPNIGDIVFISLTTNVVQTKRLT